MSFNSICDLSFLISSFNVWWFFFSGVASSLRRPRNLIMIARIMFSRDQDIVEEKSYRHFYQLKLDFDRLTVFPAALTLRHTIEERSPLHGATAESLEACNATFVVSVVGIETVIPAAVQTHHN